ncbi:hypothetical protein SteCoe_13534 [Stentor coeruleus]|uniref:Uncharacterized protein n=1 Tax=Stentor coeruleus TaxID=5963 RepID=A0A1R2C876_9CILI|nr:hypothetical protein SteCoe_13534 [Stentor coeruleus]
MNRQIRSASDDRVLEPFNANQLISCPIPDVTFIAKTAVLNLILRDSNFSNFFNKFGATPQFGLLKSYLKEKREPKDILKYTTNSTPVSIIRKLVEMIKEKSPDESLIEIKEGKLKDVPLIIAQKVISPKIHITLIYPDKVNLEFVDTLSMINIKSPQLGLRGMLLRKNAQTAALVYCGNKIWLLWKFFNEMKFDKYSNAILEIVDSGFYPEVIIYSSTSNPDDTKIDLEIYRNIIFTETLPIEESKNTLSQIPDLSKQTNIIATKELIIVNESFNKNVQKTNAPIKPISEVKKTDVNTSGNRKSGETDSTWGSFGQKNSLIEEKKTIEENKVEIKKNDTSVNENVKMWKCNVCNSKVRLDKINCDCGYKNALLAKAHAVGFKTGTPCANCDEYSKDFLCLKCVQKNFWSCVHCTFINNGYRPCGGCGKSKLNS